MYKASFTYLLGKGLSGVLSLIALFLTIRLLPSELYGYFSLVIAATTFTSTLATHWIRSSYVRFANDDMSVLSGVMRIFIISCIVFIPILYIVNWVVGVESDVYVYSLIIFFSLAIYDFHLEVFRSHGKVAKYNTSSILRPVTYMVLLTGLSYFSEKNISFTIFLLAVSVSYILWPVFFRFHKELSVEKFKNESTLKMLHFGGPLALSASAGVLLLFTDRVILSRYFSLEEVGIYAAVYDVTQQVTGAVLLSISLPFLPKISSVYRDFSSAATELKKMLLIFNLVAFPLLVILISEGGFFFSLLIDDNSELINSEIVAMLSIGIYLSCLGTYFYSLSPQIENKTLMIFYISLFASIVNIVCCLLFIPKLDFFGAALSSFISYAVFMMVMLFWARKNSNFPIVTTDVFKCFIAALVMCLFLLSTKQFLLLNNQVYESLMRVLISLGLYLLVLYILNPAGLSKLLKERYALN